MVERGCDWANKNSSRRSSNRVAREKSDIDCTRSLLVVDFARAVGTRSRIWEMKGGGTCMALPSVSDPKVNSLVLD